MTARVTSAGRSGAELRNGALCGARVVAPMLAHAHCRLWKFGCRATATVFRTAHSAGLCSRGVILPGCCVVARTYLAPIERLDTLWLPLYRVLILQSAQPLIWLARRIRPYENVVSSECRRVACLNSGAFPRVRMFWARGMGHHRATGTIARFCPLSRRDHAYYIYRYR